MAWNTGDVVSVTFKQEYLGQTCVNKLYYLLDLVDPAVNVIEAFQQFAELWVDAARSAQNTALVHSEQVFVNETDGISIYVNSYSQAGQVAGADLSPSFVAFGIKKAVATRLTRPGSLRIVGILDSYFDGNSVAPGIGSAFTSLSALMVGDISVFDTLAAELSMENIIVKRNPDGSLNLTTFQPVVDASGYTITTQNSRKP